MAKRIFTKKKITKGNAKRMVEATQILRDKNINFEMMIKEEGNMVFRHGKKKVAVWNKKTEAMEVIEYEV